MIGIRDNNTWKRLRHTPKLGLKTCLDICKAYEATAHQLKDMSDGQEEPEEVSIVKNKQTGSGAAAGESLNGQQNPGTVPCRYCGRTHSQRRDRCPAWGKTCHACCDRNHFSAKCTSKSRGKPKVNVVQGAESEDPEDYISTVDLKVSGKSYPKKLYATMVLEGTTKVRFQLDCGATVNVLPQSSYALL